MKNFIKNLRVSFREAFRPANIAQLTIFLPATIFFFLLFAIGGINVASKKTQSLRSE